MDAIGEFRYIDICENKKKAFNKGKEKLVENGVCIMRMQPMHNAHLYIIETMLQMCENVTVILGSENKVDMLRNPFDIQLRKQILLEALDEKDRGRVEIYTLADWSTEGDIAEVKYWGMYLYMNIVSRIETKRFTIFYNDEPEIIENWFEESFLREDRISFFFMDRGTMFDGLSATKIRRAFETGDTDYIKKYCPESVIIRYKELREQWFNVKENPRDDFSMQ